MKELAFKLVAKCIRLFPKSKKITRSDLLTEVKTVSGKTVVPNGVYYSPMPIIGIQLLSIDDVLAPHAKTINDIVKRSGLSDGHPQFNPNKLIHGVIWRTAEYVHLLPASEDYHHIEAGGLLSHSLEVAKTALGAAYNTDLPAKTHSDLETIRRSRYFYAVFIAALLHDIGKVFMDVRVYSVDNGNLMWEPRLESLTAWALKHGVNSYRVEYRPGRAKSHERAANYVLSAVLTNEAKEYLLACKTDDMFTEIDEAISHYAERDSYIAQALRQGDSYSTLQDIKGRHSRDTGRRNYSLATHFIHACQRLTPNWKINQRSGMVWTIGGDAYLAFPNALNTIMQDIAVHGVKAPKDVHEVYNLLVEQHIVEATDSTTRCSFWMPGEYTTEQAFTAQENIAIKRVGQDWIAVVKLKSVHYAFGSGVMPESRPGVLLLSREGNMLHFEKGKLYQPTAHTAKEMQARVKQREEKAKEEEAKLERLKVEREEQAIKEAREKAEAQVALERQQRAAAAANEQVETPAEQPPIATEPSGAQPATAESSEEAQVEAEVPCDPREPTEDDAMAHGDAQESVLAGASTNAATLVADAAQGVTGGENESATVVSDSAVEVASVETTADSVETPAIDQQRQDTSSGVQAVTPGGNAFSGGPNRLRNKHVPPVAAPAVPPQPDTTSESRQQPNSPQWSMSKRQRRLTEAQTAPAPHQAPESVRDEAQSNTGETEKATAWIEWVGNQRGEGKVLYHQVEGATYLRLTPLSQQLMQSPDAVLQTLNLAGTLARSQDKAGLPVVVQHEVAEGVFEAHCKLSASGEAILNKSTGKVWGGDEFKGVFWRSERDAERARKTETPLTEMDASTPDTATAMPTQQEGDPAPQQLDTHDHEQINLEALGSALDSSNHRLSEILRVHDVLKHRKTHRDNKKATVILDDNSTAYEAAFFEACADGVVSCHMKELKSFQRKIEGTLYYVVPPEF
ncbi:MobH family relaxase [Aeromonas caviae]|uniref:MobH family relaxase n=1 Tax=Aeromonas caviae TaxID=648 RepID=UPI001FC7E275|nr:MobH family relaxase [Aeromonas caviae]GKR51850.1 hypothetical protein KAM475_09970 [Aeromonas caviae]GKR90986.1 hypothetical protein KAM484_17910 [Aeromonas caviae]